MVRRGVHPGMECPPEDASHVGIHHRCRPLVGERRHRSGGVATHARQGLQLLGIRGNDAVVLCDHGPGEPVEICGTPVVPQPLPGFANRARSSRRKRLDGRIPRQKGVVVLLDADDLRLLQHELRHRDVVGIAGAAPGQIAAVAVKPAEQSAAELGCVAEGTRGRLRRHVAPRYSLLRGAGRGARSSAVTTQAAAPGRGFLAL